MANISVFLGYASGPGRVNTRHPGRLYTRALSGGAAALAAACPQRPEREPAGEVAESIRRHRG